MYSGCTLHGHRRLRLPVFGFCFSGRIINRCERLWKNDTPSSVRLALGVQCGNLVLQGRRGSVCPLGQRSNSHGSESIQTGVGIGDYSLEEGQETDTPKGIALLSGTSSQSKRSDPFEIGEDNAGAHD